MLAKHSKEKRESWGGGYKVLGWEWAMVLHRMVSRGLTEKMTFGKDQREVREPAILIPEGVTPDRRNSQCKGPEVKHGWQV